MKIQDIQFGPVVSVLPFTAVADSGWVSPPRRMFARTRVRMRGGGVLLHRAIPRRPLKECLSFSVHKKPFFLPITVLASDAQTRMLAWRSALTEVEQYRKTQPTPFGVIIDTTIADMPGTYDDSVTEISQVLGLFSSLRIPLGVRFSVLTPPDIVGDIVRLAECDALFVSEYVPWNSLTPESQTVFFRRKQSPFPENGGFVSGKYILPLLCEWVRQLRRQGIRKPVVGVGVLRARDIDTFKEAGISAITLGGAVRALWPWNILGILRRARTVFSNESSRRHS